MEFIIIGIVSALNLIVIIHKFKKGRTEDSVFDLTLFVVMASLFTGSYGGMVVAMISSLIISIYLWAYPPTFFSGNKGMLKTFAERVKKKGTHYD